MIYDLRITIYETLAKVSIFPLRPLNRHPFATHMTFSIGLVNRKS